MPNNGFVKELLKFYPGLINYVKFTWQNCVHRLKQLQMVIKWPLDIFDQDLVHDHRNLHPGSRLGQSVDPNAGSKIVEWQLVYVMATIAACRGWRIVRCQPPPRSLHNGQALKSPSRAVFDNKKSDHLSCYACRKQRFYRENMALIFPVHNGSWLFSYLYFLSHLDFTSFSR